MPFAQGMQHKQPKELLTLVKIGESEKEINKNLLLGHYISVWMKSMGYLNPETKHKLIMNL